MDIRTFLFGPYPLALQSIDKILAIVIVAVLVTGVFLSIFLRLSSLGLVNFELLRRFKNLFLFFGLTGLVWLGFRYENAMYLTWRFWIGLLAVAAIIWLFKILFYIFSRYPKDLAEWRRKEVKEKYLK